jgi:hypothetical protein
MSDNGGVIAGYSRPKDGVASLAHSRPKDRVASLAHSRPKDRVASLAYARKRRDPAIHERVQLKAALRKTSIIEPGSWTRGSCPRAKHHARG